MNFRNGDVISSKYRVERVLGEGGMGVVLAAMHLELGQRVAIKFMRDEILDQPDIKQRFMREARAVAKLRSAHTARVMDVTEDDGPPYIVMEYLEGEDLASLLKKKGPLPPIDVAEYVLQACEALSEAHAARIVHRDLKPANLFLTNGPGGRQLVKVLDFGVSKLIDAAWDENAPGEGGANSPGRTRRPKQDRMALTRMNDFLGSLNYMSPEQIKSAKDVDAQTDIWSLGVIMYRLVSGKLPFTGSNDDDLVAKIMTGVVTPLSDIVTEISPEFEDVVARCLERDRRRRFRNVEELARELAPLARNPKSPSLERIALLQAAGFTPASLGVRAAEASAPRTPMAVATGDYTSSVRTMATEFRRAMMDFASQATQRGMRRKTILYLVVIVVSLIVMGGAVARYGADDGHAYPETGLPLAPGARSGVPRDQPPPPVPPALSVPPALTARIAPTALPAASAITVPSAGSAAPKTTAAARPPVVPQVRPRWTPPPPPLPAVTVTPVPGIPPSRE